MLSACPSGRSFGAGQEAFQASTGFQDIHIHAINVQCDRQCVKGAAVLMQRGRVCKWLCGGQRQGTGIDSNSL